MKEEGNIRNNERIEIITRDLDGNIIDREVLKNVITKLNLNLHRDAVAGTLVNLDDLELKYIGYGDGTAVATENDIWLGNELGVNARIAITSSDATVDKKYSTVFKIPSTDWIGTIEEVGWFGGNAATVAKNTGTLMARALYHKVKTIFFSIQINRIDTFSEV